MNVSRSERALADGLTASLARVRTLQSRADLRRDMPANWLRCSDLLDDPAGFDRWRKELDGWLRPRFGEAPERTTASYVMSWYLHVPAYLGALLMHHERRVPALRPSELAFSLGDDRPHPEGMALSGDDFYCLPSDPGCDLPGATVVADEHALAAMLRTRYIAHAAQFVRVYGTVGPFGKRTLWAAATDALDNSLWWAGKQGGDEGAGVADAALVLANRYAPLTSASTLETHERADGHREWARRRESCCFSYLLPGETECDACPRVRRRA